jgi:hypothetical protein
MSLLNSAGNTGWNEGGALGYQQLALNQLQNSAPQIQNTLNAQTQDQANTSYDQAKKNIDTSYNQRGLLYSGLKQGSEAGAANQAAQGAASGTANNNAYVNSMVNNANQQATNSALQGFGGYANANYQNFQNNMAAYNQSQQASGALGSGLGALAGLGIGALTGGVGLALMGGAMGGSTVGGGLFSDKKLKKNIKDADDDIKEYLDKTEAKSFDYKDEDKGEGKHFGLMAQDIEKSPAGKVMVIESPEGKQIDPKKALMMVMAVSSHLNKRLNKVEKYSEGGEVKSEDNSQINQIDPQKAEAAQDSMRKAFHFKLGGSVPGEGRGDHVLGLLTPREIVLPTKVTMSKNPGEKAKKFVEKEKAS